MIAVIDYDAGNLNSVEKALLYIGEKAVITRDTKVIQTADKLVLPGVGAFGDAVGKLIKYGLFDLMREVAFSGKPFLGICLGMQLLFKSSEESPGVEGLDILPGRVCRIPVQKDLKIPHMGWNSLEVTKGARLYQGIEPEPYVYFVHSYYVSAEQESDVAAKTEYGTLIHASVEHGMIFGCQFHPEKSGDVGLQILKNFALL